MLTMKGLSSTPTVGSSQGIQSPYAGADPSETAVIDKPMAQTASVIKVPSADTYILVNRRVTLPKHALCSCLVVGSHTAYINRTF